MGSELKCVHLQIPWWSHGWEIGAQRHAWDMLPPRIRVEKRSSSDNESTSCQLVLRVGNSYLEDLVLLGRTGVVAWVLPEVLPGVLPGVTWCYLECYLDVTWVVILGSLFFCGPKISAFLNLKLLKTIISPGNVTWSRVCPCYLVAWPTLGLRAGSAWGARARLWLGPEMVHKGKQRAATQVNSQKKRRKTNMDCWDMMVVIELKRTTLRVLIIRRNSSSGVSCQWQEFKHKRKETGFRRQFWFL